MMTSDWADEALRVHAVLSTLAATCRELVAPVPDDAQRATQLLEDWLGTRTPGDLDGVWMLVRSAEVEVSETERVSLAAAR